LTCLLECRQGKKKERKERKRGRKRGREGESRRKWISIRAGIGGNGMGSENFVFRSTLQVCI